MNVTERFLNYVKFPTMSDENSETVPSSAKQLKLAEFIVNDLKNIGLEDAYVDKYGYVYATLEANCDAKAPVLGLIAHMDTSDAASDTDIKPATVDYSGGDILLNEEKNITMKVADYPYLDNYKGQHLIVTDGTTLLGADDKAGVAEIITAVENLKSSGVKHGKIRIGITPDEEIGRGADYFNVEEFAADYAYTVDGGTLGEIEYENFNAASAKIKVNGISIHPGSAKGKMKNASLIACEFNALLPADEIPSKTEGYEGFHHLCDMEGSIEIAKLSYIIRDHDRTRFEAKKQQFVDAAAEMNSRHGEGTVELTLTDSYYNMKEKIEPCMYVIDRAKKAFSECGVNAVEVPIRGGTDGARLSFMGLPCPNLCTGGENFHSRFEFVSVEAMEKITEILQKIVTDLI